MDTIYYLKIGKERSMLFECAEGTYAVGKTKNNNSNVELQKYFDRYKCLWIHKTHNYIICDKDMFYTFKELDVKQLAVCACIGLVPMQTHLNKETVRIIYDKFCTCTMHRTVNITIIID